MGVAGWPTLAINEEGGEAPVAHLFLACFLLLAPLLAPMAPIRRFFAEEKGKAPRDAPEPLPPKKRSIHHRDEAAMQVVTRPWCMRPPPGYPLPLYARAEGSGGQSDERRRPLRARGRRATAMRAVAPGIHAADSSRELALWAPMPPSSWIRFPQFFSNVMPPRGPLKLWLQHADCNAPATGSVAGSRSGAPPSAWHSK